MEVKESGDFFGSGGGECGNAKRQATGTAAMPRVGNRTVSVHILYHQLRS